MVGTNATVIQLSAKQVLLKAERLIFEFIFCAKELFFLSIYADAQDKTGEAKYIANSNEARYTEPTVKKL
ncbi:MAG: hypothetical protein ACI4V4_06320 [Eubacterium sp.]